MIAAGERAQRHVRSFENVESLAGDEVYSDPVIRALEVMGEACKSVKQSIRDRFPTIRWKSIAGMRDRLIHGYDDVDWPIVWETVITFVPTALKELEVVHATLLAEEPPDTSENA